jgi:hypothetical protein
MLQRIGTELKPALAYLRRDSGSDERKAIYAFAARSGFEIIAELKDPDERSAAARPQAMPRPALCALLTRIKLNAVSAVIVGTAGLFADAAIDRVVGYERLREKGVELIAADAPDAFQYEALAHAEIALALASAAQFDQAAAAAEAASVARSRGIKTGKPHRKTYADLAPEATLMAKRLFQSSKTNGERISLREISARLAAVGFVQANRQPYHPEVIRRMLKGQWPRSKSA